MFYYIKNENIFISKNTLDENILCDEIIESEIEEGKYSEGKIIEGDVYHFTNYPNNVLRKMAYKKFDDALLSITSVYSENEQKSFSKKLIEAEKVKEGKNSNFINKLLKEGETAEELADKIIANNDIYEDIYAAAEKQLKIDLNNIN